VDDQVKTTFSVSCVASGDTGMQTGRESVGHTMGFELFDRYQVAELAERAAQRALTKLGARPAPSGQMTVEVDQGHLRSIVRAVEHGFAGKESSHANPINPSDQPPLLPAFHTVGMPGPGQLFIRLQKARGDPGRGGSTSGHRGTSSNDG
jgi:hypothetical protein